jgi:hypothetical protein
MNITEDCDDTTSRAYEALKRSQQLALGLLSPICFPNIWNRCNPPLLDSRRSNHIRQHPLISNSTLPYTNYFDTEQHITRILDIATNLTNANTYSINSSAIKDALLLLKSQKDNLDNNHSRIALLQLPSEFSQSPMEYAPLVHLGMPHLMDNHHFHIPPFRKRSKRNPLLSFPHQLHEILSNPEYSDYITWLPNSNAWMIVQRQQFESIVLPRHFRHGRFTSFMRQVRRTKVSNRY